MENTNNNTEKNILDAAVILFSENGFNGTSMQMIADKSKTNKALLHYYYRNKKQLFERVFDWIAKDFFDKVQSVFETEESLFERIHHLIKVLVLYTESKKDNVNFLISELRRESAMVDQFKGKLPVQLKKGILTFFHQVNEAMEVRKIRQIPPQILLETIFSLCLLDSKNKNFYMGLFGNNDSEFSNTEEIIKIRTEIILRGIGVG